MLILSLEFIISVIMTNVVHFAFHKPTAEKYSI